MFKINFNGDPFKEFRESMQKIASQSIKIDKALSPILKQFKEISEKVPSLHLEKYQALFETIAKEAEKIPDRVDIIHDYLSSRGWFVPFHLAPLTAFQEYEQLIKNEKHEVIEKKLQSYIREHISVFKKEVASCFPDRFRIVNSAFQAHKEGKYELSIPIFLIQADGMFSDLIGTTFYTNKEVDLKKIKRNLVIKLSENGHSASTSSFGYLLIKQLHEESILHENFSEIEKRKDRNPDLDPLNRNTILHGRDINYDSEANSLRAISLIGLLCDCNNSFTMRPAE